MWTCPKCKRQFEKTNQSHSCTVYPISKHFENKDESKQLYNKLKEAVKKEVGIFKIEALPCCIHFVSTFTFAAVKVFKDKIRVNFTLNHVLKNKKARKNMQTSSSRIIYDVDIASLNEIDKELVDWIKQAYNIRKK